MATLTQTSVIARRGIQGFIILIVVMIVGRFMLNAAVSIWKQLNPPPPPPPTMGFGILPPIQFPQSTVIPPTSYQLETPTGQLPDTPYTLKVFPVITESPDLLALDRSKVTARSLGFQSEPIALTDSLYRWQKSGSSNSNLEIFIYQGNLTMWVDWYADPGYIIKHRPPSQAQALSTSLRYLDQARFSHPDLVSGRIETVFLKALGSDYMPTVSLSEADFIRFDLFRSNIDETYEVITPDPNRGIVEFILSGDATINYIVWFDYNYYPINNTIVHTYPVKPVEIAWQEVTDGTAYIARFTNNQERAIIRRVTIAYLDSYNPQPFLQPVWVFYGDDDFVAYTPAVMIPTTQDSR